MKTENINVTGKYLIRILLLIFSFQIFSVGQPKEPHFISLSLEKGIPLNQTYAMIQDREGYLWMGTMYGLIRYDGRDYKVYNYDAENPESISFNDVISIYEDSKDNLWIGTWGGGLNMLNKDRTKFRRFIYNPKNKNGIRDNIVWSIAEDKKGNIWLETAAGGINKYSPATNKFSVYELGDSDSLHKQIHVNDLFVDSNGNLWAGSILGLSEFSDSANSFVTYPVSLNGNTSFQASIYNIYENTGEKLILGTSKGLIYFNMRNKKFDIEKSLPEKRIISISKDHYGILWLGTTNGLIKFDPVNSTFVTYLHSDKPNSICGNFVKNVFEDQSGVIWVNCYNNGISKMINRKSNFSLLQANSDEKNSLSNDRITALTEDKDGNIWIGTEKGLNKFYPATNTTEQFSNSELSDKNINALAVDKNNSIIISTGSDLYKYNQSNKTLNGYLMKEHNIFEDKTINNLLVDNDGNLWIGTYSSGIFLLKNGKFIHYLPAERNSANRATNYILTFYEDNSGNVWIGTYGGLLLYNSKDNNFNSYQQELNNPKTLSNNYVFCLTEDSENKLCIGTASGLNLFDRTSGSFKSFFVKDGLPSDVICGLVKDDSGNLWVSTQKGISRFDPEKKLFVNFNKDDGLQSNLFTEGVFLKGKNSEIYFGGRKGLNYFDPSNVTLNKYESPVIISSVSLIGDKKEIQSSTTKENALELDYDQNSLLIKIASLDYSNPGRTMFKYKLIGYDNKLIDLKNNDIIKLQNLPPGDYSLIVQGSNSDGVWSSKAANLFFIIYPPFWKTTLFYMVVLILIITASVLIHRLILRSKVKRAVQIEKIKEEEGERIRRKTAIDFHDELGHRLTRISMLTELIKLKMGNSFSDINSLLEQISENSKQLYEGTKDFIWSIDPSKDSLYELIVRLKDFGDELYGNTNVRFEVTGLDEKLQNALLSMDLKRHLTLILKEGMNNSLKHSRGDKVSLNTEIDGDKVEIKLEDNGAGFSENINKKGFGLKNMKARAKKINASLRIDSLPGQGTKILLKGKFPIKSLNYA